MDRTVLYDISIVFSSDALNFCLRVEWSRLLSIRDGTLLLVAHKAC